MNYQLDSDIQINDTKKLMEKQMPTSPIEKHKMDLHQLNLDLEQRKIAALQVNKQHIRKSIKMRQQQRLQNKALIFQKYYQIIEKELQVLKIEMENQNELFYQDQHFFTLRTERYPIITELLVRFEQNLKNLRVSACTYKYCCKKWQVCCPFWSCCWFTIACYCCYRSYLKESVCQTQLLQLYEKYQLMMQQQNTNIQVPAK